ncbi:hypothetical protein [Pseudotabrizicola formosa]|uniref:hypothetical protein n=1 Tax=Pseudotabrizicola formosa TaxID=2030009 RepID=UPI0011AFCF65|nr:hypothetical protein [Pseudotabrizicola formosa]
MPVRVATSVPDRFDLRGRTSPFISIGLPQVLARHCAGPRPLFSVAPQDIAQAGLHRMSDALIACMLLGSEVDALDILAELTAAGYRGTVVVIAPPLPDPGMVERELALAAPGMTVSLLVL